MTQSLLQTCANFKDVYGVNHTVLNVTGLNENTLYYLAVKAGTIAGFGKIGNIVNGTTSEAGMCFLCISLQL